MPRKLWEHPDPKSTAMWRFMQDANAKYGLNMQVSLTIHRRGLRILRELLTSVGLSFSV